MKILRSFKDERVINGILDRSPELLIDEKIKKRVDKIINDVRSRGDEALCEYTAMFDGVRLNPGSLKVTEEEFKEAEAKIDGGFKEVISLAISNIEKFHKQETRRFKSWKRSSCNVILGEIYRPVKKVGVYVPAGTAPLFSSLLMACIPARMAGVKEITITTPPRKDGRVNPYILAAALLVKVDRVYKVGGAQAIAALAFGTSTIPRVDKIVGPGNIYVTAAKQALYGYVGLDTLAGPSEIAILADDGAIPSYIASDILAQAEHSLDSRILLLTTSEIIAREVDEKIQGLELDQRFSSIKNGMIIITSGLDEAISFVNRYAPEHLELFVNDPLSIVEKISNAGAIFAGPYSPTSLGDYIAGPSHILPTMGAARFSSPLGIRDFVKASSLIYYDKDGLEKIGPAVIKMAQIEGLDGHAQSIQLRIENRS